MPRHFTPKKTPDGRDSATLERHGTHRQEVTKPPIVWRRSRCSLFLFLCLTILIALPLSAYAFELNEILDQLYTEDGFAGINPGGASAGFQDISTTELSSLNDQLGEGLTQPSLPSGTASLGVVFDLNTGLLMPTTESLGPIYSERAQTLGKNRLKVGVSYSRLDYDEFEGDDISKLVVLSPVDKSQLKYPYTEDKLYVENDFDITQDVVVFYASYGITEKIDISVLMPYINLDYKVKSHARLLAWDKNVNDYVWDPDSADQNEFHYWADTSETDPRESSAKGNAYGIGDVVIRGKYFIYSAAYADIAVAIDFKLPTGDKDNFLGTGDLNVKPFLILSKTFYNGRFNPHANIGYEYNGTDSDLSQLVWFAGFDSRITDRLTAVVDFAGFNELNGDGVGDNIFDINLGLKYNTWRSLIVFGSVQMPLNDEGLRADFVPTVGVEYTF